MLLLTWLLASPISLAADRPPLNGKVDAEVHDVSRQFAASGQPKEKIDAWWLGAAASKDWEKTPHHYRHLHAMVAAAAFDRRQDHQEEARRWLEAYECENVLACREARSFLDGALKAKASPISKASRRKLEALRAKLEARAKKLRRELPPTNGLCAPNAERTRWLELEYELFCPPYPFPVSGSCGFLTEKAGECSDTAALKFRIERDSMQMALSSSFLADLRHQGPPDCSAPWKAELACGGMRDVRYVVRCERTGGKVRCVEDGEKREP